MISGRQLIYQALRDICELRAGQTTSTDILNDGLTRLNQMVSTWRLDRLMVPAVTPQVYTMTAGQQQYTIGPTGASFTAARPTRIEYANCILNTVNPVVRVPIEVIDYERWRGIAVQQLPFAIPQVLWYEDALNANGSGTVNVWPGPQTNYGLEIYTWGVLSEFADLDTSYGFKDGYEAALRTNLAVLIAPMMMPYYKVPQPMLDAVAMQAVQTKAAIEAFNTPESKTHVDAAFRQGNSAGGYFNWGDGTIVGR